MGIFGKNIEGKNARQWALEGYRKYHLKGLYESEIECYDKSLELKPDNPRVLNNKGTALTALERYKEAIHCLEKATEINPRLEDAWYNLGSALRSLGRFSEAINAYDTALRINPKDKDAIEQKKICVEKLLLQSIMDDEEY